MLIFILPLFITNSVFFTLILIIGIGLIIIGILPALSYNKNKDIEYLITNQRILIYPSPYAEKNRPKIINLYEINGEIAMKYNEDNNTGSIYIPTPQWNRIVSTQIYPDIKNIKDPHIPYDILIEAIAIGKRTNWK